VHSRVRQHDGPGRPPEIPGPGDKNLQINGPGVVPSRSHKPREAQHPV
jgi:hypothetical protein